MLHHQVSFYFNSQEGWAFTAVLSADRQASEQASMDFVTLRGKEGELEVPLERSLHSYWSHQNVLHSKGMSAADCEFPLSWGKSLRRKSDI